MHSSRHEYSSTLNVFQGELSSEQLNYFRSFKYIDVLVYLCLQYLRSYYPHVPQQGPMTARDVVGNCNVRLLTCDVLQAIFQMLEERMHTRKELPGLVLELLNRLVICLASLNLQFSNNCFLRMCIYIRKCISSLLQVQSAKNSAPLPRCFSFSTKKRKGTCRCLHVPRHQL